MREYSKTLQFERDDLSQKLTDARGDIKVHKLIHLLTALCHPLQDKHYISLQLLREQIARNRVGSSDEGVNSRHFDAHDRQRLVQQLEEAREQVRQPAHQKPLL